MLRTRRLAFVLALAVAPACAGEGAPTPPPLECDDLPALTPEELARPPRDVPLGKSVPSEPRPTPSFSTLSDVTLSDKAAARVQEIDQAYFRRTGAHLVVTSGTRDAARQAKAMHKVLKLGGDILKLYRNKEAAREIKQAYDSAAGKPQDDVVTAMHAVIQGQIDRGVFISAHLSAGAVDIRNRTMSPAEKRAFEKSVAEVGGTSLLEETTPPHYHLHID